MVVGGVCDMCLARGGVGGVKGVRERIGFWLYQFWRNMGKVGFWLRWWGWGRVGGRLEPGSGRVGYCYVCVCCESGFPVLMAGTGICILTVLGGFLRILGAPSVQSCCTISISVS